jgi:CubicO group peptidase (beta-lactamase class C family)
MRIGKALLVFVLLAALASCAAAPRKPAERVPGDYTHTREYTSWLIANEMRKHDVTGLSIALVDDQRVIWAQGFGFADKAKDVRAGPETVYQVGSISKVFTATSAMQLAERGRIDIDRPVRTYLPGFSIKSRFNPQTPITARQLMTHHSGLPRDVMKGMWTAQPEPFTRVLGHLADEYQAYPPGLVFAYSNVGVSLLGHLIQEVAGRDFASYIEESLLRPIGMTHAYLAPVIGAGERDSKGYRKGKEATVTPLRDLPAGGLHASVADLSRFMMVMFADGRAGNRQIIKRATLHEMWRVQNTDVPLDLDLHVGLGWVLSALGDANIRNAGKVVHHSGGTPLFHSQLILLLERKLGVVVLANSASARPAVQKVAAEVLKLALEAKTGIAQPPEVKWNEAAEAPSEETMRAFEGQYTTLIGAAEITRRWRGLRVEVAGLKLRMVPRGDGWFGLQYRLLGIIPISLSELDPYAIGRSSIAGREVVSVSDGYTRFLAGERLTPRAIPEAWQRRTGKYEIVNREQDEPLFDDPSLVIKNGLLLLQVTMAGTDARGDIVVEPLSDTEALLLGPLAGAGETIRAMQVDGVEMWRYSGYLFKRKAG